MNLRLAINEYCKDYGIMSDDKRNKISILFIRTDEDGNNVFEVTDRNRIYPYSEIWTLEKIDLSSLDHFKVVLKDYRKETVIKVIKLLRSECGYNLDTEDIHVSLKTSNQIKLLANQSSLLYKGEIILEGIQNDR